MLVLLLKGFDAMKRIKNIFTNLDEIDLKIMKYGIIFSLIIAIVGTLLLSYNLLFVHTIFLFKIVFGIIKLSSYFIVEFIVCGIVVDKIIYHNELL